MERVTPEVSRGTYAITLVWLLLLTAGMGAMARYDSQAGTRGTLARSWIGPSQELPLDVQRPTGLLFLHPRCPCSVASVHELGQLMRDVDVAWHVVSFVPAGSDLRAARAWSAGRQQNALEALTGLHQVFDPGGQLAELHGVQTSGHLLLFSPTGELLYEGGLTAARGHIGPCAAGTRARKAARGEGEPWQAPSQAPVYGCSLLSKESLYP